MGLDVCILRNHSIQEWVPPKRPSHSTISSSFLAAWSWRVVCSLRLASLLFSPTILLFCHSGTCVPPPGHEDKRWDPCFIRLVPPPPGPLAIPPFFSLPPSLLRPGCLFSQDSQPRRWGRGLQSLAQSPCQALICMQKGLGGIYRGLTLGSCSRPRNALPMAACSGQD